LQQELVILQVPSSPAYVSVVRNAVATLARRMPFSNQDICDIQLAVGEACNNAVKHGMEDGGYPVRVICTIAPSNISVEVINRYDGDPPCRPIGAKPEPCQYNEGGMGVFLMKTLVDSVQFRWGKSTATVKLTKSVQA
jgi:serine/threonine-protein kinase RsbW